jgi:hypothetical protein
VPQCFHHTVFPSLFGEHSKTGKTRFSVCPYCQVTAHSVNVLLGNTRIWETLKNVTPDPDSTIKNPERMVDCYVTYIGDCVIQDRRKKGRRRRESIKDGVGPCYKEAVKG